MRAFENHRTIGLVGGMGPQAGLTLFNYILQGTKARFDQEHLSTVLMSFPRHIVDRTAFINGSETINPAFSIVEVIKNLEAVGASIIGIACNTSYAPEIHDVIVDELSSQGSQIKLVHMPFETCKLIPAMYPNARKIGLMTSNGTYNSGLYVKLLEEMGYEVIVPDSYFQSDVIHRMIYDTEFGLKTNVNTITKEVCQLMDRTLTFFKENNTDTIILGCTEFSSTNFKKTFKNIQVIDSSEALANALVKEATSFDNE